MMEFFFPFLSGSGGDSSRLLKNFLLYERVQCRQILFAVLELDRVSMELFFVVFELTSNGIFGFGWVTPIYLDKQLVVF